MMGSNSRGLGSHTGNEAGGRNSDAGEPWLHSGSVDMMIMQRIILSAPFILLHSTWDYLHGCTVGVKISMEKYIYTDLSLYFYVACFTMF
jgi:hypothetical protein